MIESIPTDGDVHIIHLAAVIDHGLHRRKAQQIWERGRRDQKIARVGQDNVHPAQKNGPLLWLYGPDVLAGIGMHFFALFFTIAVFVLFLGCKQKAHLDRHGIAAMILFLVLEATIVSSLRGTPLFSVACFATAVLLGVHLAIVNFNTPTSCDPFQQGDPPPSPYHAAFIMTAVAAGAVSAFKL